MPEFTTVEKGGRIRHIIKAQPGEQFMLCRCMGSKEFPFCDGTHKNMPFSVGPAVVEIAQTKEETEEEE